MQDGGLGHANKDAIEELQTRDIYPIFWPAFSPDLNPIEALCDWMKDWIQGQYPEEETLSYDQLREVVRASWDVLPEQFLKDLIDSMQARCQAVIDAAGPTMATPTPRTILITGATGKQGSAVIDALLAADDSDKILSIIAVTRDTTSRSAQALARRPNVCVVAGDLADPDSIFDQATVNGNPVWGVFGVQINSPEEEKQGKALVAASVARGVQHFVYASGDRGGTEKSEIDPTFVKNFAAKFNIEKHLQKMAATSPQGMTYSILRPVTFFENMTADIHGKGFARMWEQMGPNKALQLISTKDIGYVAAQAFIHPDKYRNVAMTLVGDELTQPEAGVIFQEVLGFSMPMAPCPIGSAVKFFKKDTVGDMFRWFEENGYGGDVVQCRKEFPGLMDYRTWLVERSSFVQRP
ncbi:transposable element tc1 transposase, putative [Talaromyces stipitatus ATCC 10500]|uniref:Transposable element tc1 transposase, putative n=1 Tax=Talaromyces stipitatus (strain ATCC 10500 / CBS 375.48 / QM 6759 / NRRL 1006) TaxID=441959 RepID=B8MM11_TALSN|nr:transposable element tc1 transposase, putative [Talaromyces stipitatus ATCC 10500]EED13523.1 transposable element tc1 transposase, putative [Talaromyces stipitatus ATCC 10500]